MVKEKVHQIKYQNKKKIKKVVAEKKVHLLEARTPVHIVSNTYILQLVGLNAEVWLPLILVPENGNIARYRWPFLFIRLVLISVSSLTHSSDRCLAVNPGYLEVKTKGMPVSILYMYN